MHTSASATVQAATSPSITATASANDASQAAVATTIGQLIYYIDVSGPTGSVLLDFTGLGSVASTIAPPGDFSSDIQLSVGGNLIAYVGSTDGVASLLGTSPGVAAGWNPNGFTISDSMSVSANTAIEVILFAEATAEGAGSASASLDPYFFVDPSTANANEYSVITDGIGNSPATTPIPAALPLFATGLGALGLLGRRRKHRRASWFRGFLIKTPENFGETAAGPFPICHCAHVAVHESESGPSCHFAATKQIGRYRRHNGHCRISRSFASVESDP